MVESLSYLLQVEDAKEFELAFDLYRQLYAEDKSSYETWKHFYFFLWAALEEMPAHFQQRIKLESLLPALFAEGKERFGAVAEFNFLSGYTIAIYPYLYGEFDAMEKAARQLLLKATELNPDNPIFRLAYLGSNPTDFNKPEYDRARAAAAASVLSVFSGPELLNSYFRYALYRP